MLLHQRGLNPGFYFWDKKRSLHLYQIPDLLSTTSIGTNASIYQMGYHPRSRAGGGDSITDRIKEYLRNGALTILISDTHQFLANFCPKLSPSRTMFHSNYITCRASSGLREARHALCNICYLSRDIVTKGKTRQYFGRGDHRSR